MSEVPDPDELFRQATEFATDLTRTVRAVVGDGARAFEADYPTTGASLDGTVLFIEQRPAEGIVLTVGGEPLLTLHARFVCSWDSRSTWLTVIESTMRVHGPDSISTVPLFRYEYDRAKYDPLPAAHLHVHGEHPALSGALGMGGPGSKRSKQRQKKAARGAAPALSELHFPLGEVRFRPCLEDVLGILVEEFGVDTPGSTRAGARGALEQGREKWRRTQVATVVRDAPGEAARVLRDLGYEVTAPTGRVTADRLDRLRCL